MIAKARGALSLALLFGMPVFAAAQATSSPEPEKPKAPWYLSGGSGFAEPGGHYGGFLEEPLQLDLRIAKATTSGKWRFGMGLQFGSMNMKPPYQDQEEWAHLETFGTVTRVFSRT